MDWKAFFGHRIFKLASAATFAASAYLVQPYRPVVFVGKSMANTYQDRELAVGTTDTRNLAVGDVVVIEREGSTFVKRIAHLPGEKIEYVKISDEWIAKHSVQFSALKHPEKFKRKFVVVPAGEVYVLGDNPQISIDSRQLGTIPIELIKTKLVNPKARNPIPHK